MRTLLPLVMALSVTVAQADEAPVGAHLDIELNAATQTDTGCQLSFLIINGHDRDIAKAVYETVLFDTAGAVAQMTLFDMGELPAARPRVRQFVLPNTSCDALGKLLFNGAQICEAESLSASACTAGLTLRSRTALEVIG